jgi:hypothetical protein
MGAVRKFNARFVSCSMKFTPGITINSVTELIQFRSKLSQLRFSQKIKFEFILGKAQAAREIKSFSVIFISKLNTFIM